MMILKQKSHEINLKKIFAKTENGKIYVGVHINQLGGKCIQTSKLIFFENLQ
jgi:hypothetical protein